MSETIPADSGLLGKDSAVCVRLFRCQERTSLLLFLLLCDTQAKHTCSWTHGSRGYSARARVPAFVLDEASNRRHPKMVNLLNQQRAKKKNEAFVSPSVCLLSSPPLFTTVRLRFAPFIFKTAPQLNFSPPSVKFK